MITVTLDENDQVTFSKQQLAHLGVQVGDRLNVTPIFSSRTHRQNTTEIKPFESMRGMLSRRFKTDIRVTDEEIKRAIEDGYVQRGLSGLREAG